jgi:hydrogenase maturation factor
VSDDPAFGSVGREFGERRLPDGADRADVVSGPRYGVPFGAFGVGDRAVALSTGPLHVVPALGLGRSARLSLRRLLGGAAVSGVAPTHLAVDFTLPPDMTDDEFEAVWTATDAEASDLGVSVVTGHTARYSGCAYPTVGGGTVLAVGPRDSFVRPGGAAPNDRLVVTKGPAVGTAGLLAAALGSGDSGGGTLDDGKLDEATLAAARDRLDDATVVRDALVAAAAGPVTAMHLAGERGLYGGLRELACASGVGLDVTAESVSVLPGVGEVCAALGVDPWSAYSGGALLVTVPPDAVENVLGALDSVGIPAADAGRVVEGTGKEGSVRVDGEAVERPESDPLWERLDALSRTT